MAMSEESKLRFWLIGLAAFGLLVYLLRGILLPFVAGMAVAYFLDPLSRRIQRIGLSPTAATSLITLAFFMTVVLLLILLVPVIEDQVLSFVQKVPGYYQSLMHRAAPLWSAAKTHISPRDLERLRSAASGYAGTLAGYVGQMATKVLTGSLAVFNVVSLVFVTPVVAFYLLRDWHLVTERVNIWLPRRYAPVIRRQLMEIDESLSAFVRGQALVCLALGTFYGVGLTLVGLEMGLVVGFGAGLLSFIPYLGTLSGFLAGIGLALAQSQEWTLPGLVAGVFLIGNLIEGNVLAPKLVGEKIGLHPVWVIFALLAGGALFGFLGILLALPVAAVLGVLARFLLARYMDSSLYSDDLPKGSAP